MTMITRGLRVRSFLLLWALFGLLVPVGVHAQTTHTLSYLAGSSASMSGIAPQIVEGGADDIDATGSLATDQPPTITVQPLSRTVNPNEAATFSVTANGTAPLSYQWKKNGGDIAGATLTSYTISAAQQTDEGSYSCVVSNVAGSATSRSAILTVNDMPSITTQPISLTVMAGVPAAFSVVATGTAPLSYQWKKDGSGISGATRSSYSIAAAQEGDIGSYVCQVSNMVATVTSNPATLALVAPLTITTANPLPVAVKDSAYSLVFEAQGGTVPYTWQALGNGAYSENGSSGPMLGGGTAQGWRADDQTWTLSFPWPFTYYGINYNSVYVCSNGYVDFNYATAETTNSDADLLSRVRIAPLWDDLKTNGTGQDVFVTKTDEYVAIRWAGATYYGDHPVNLELVLYRTGDIRFNYGAAHTGLTPTIGISKGDGAHYTLSSRNGSATIPANVGAVYTDPPAIPAGLEFVDHALSGTPSQLGEYGLTLSVSDVGPLFQKCVQTFDLQVAERPTITVQPISQTILTGDPVSFSVAVSGTTPLIYQWHKGPEDITEATGEIYTITSAQFGDAGSYSCTVMNLAGSTTSNEAALSVVSPLAAALDNTLAWNTGADLPWFAQNRVSHDGVDAGQSGAISDGQSSEITTQVTGRGTLSFWWKVSSEADHDYLRFSVDGVLQDRISGNVWFGKKAYNLGPGVHTLKWKYSKDTSGSSGQDCAWLDQVSFVPNGSLGEALDNQALTWATQGDANWFGQSATAHDGQDAAQSGAITHNQSSEFSTQVTGPGTLSFWCKVWSEANHDFLRFSIDGVLKDRISGNVYFTQKQYTLGSGTQALKWKYSKDATGTAGRDAAWVDQVVWTPGGKAVAESALRIVSDADGAWTRVGATQTLTVQAPGGLPPLQYQWQKDGLDLIGATEDSLTLESAALSDTGVYTVVVRDAKNVVSMASTEVTVTKSLPGPTGTAVALWAGAFALGGIALLRRGNSRDRNI